MSAFVSEGTFHVGTAADLLKYWLGHRALTRRVIEAFPEDKLFAYSVGGMRPFAEMVWEFVKMGSPTVKGVATGEWVEYVGEKPGDKAGLLALWDAEGVVIEKGFAEIPEGRFSEADKMFGMWDATGLEGLRYVIDNEVHHRGQGYVYLRSLGIEPPAFWER